MEFEGKTFIVVGGGNLGGICNNFIKELLKLNVAVSFCEVFDFCRDSLSVSEYNN